MTEFKDTQHDIDSCKDVWEGLYKIVYLNFFEKYFDFSNLRDYETSKTCKRWYIKLRNDIEIKKEFPKFKMAGDCIFNFNENKINKLNNHNCFIATENASILHSTIKNKSFNFIPIGRWELRNAGIANENISIDLFKAELLNNRF